MKRRYKIFSLIVAVVLLLCSFPYSNVNAASGTLNISTNKTDVNKGDKVTITISLSADTVIYNGEFNLNYNNSRFSYEGYAGKIYNKYDPNTPETSKNYTWTYIFTAINTGTGEFSIDGCRMVMESGNDMVEMPISLSATSVNVTTAGSDDASLKSLQVPGHTLTPAFKPSVTAYTVYLPNATTTASINAIISQPSGRTEMSPTTIPNPLPVGKTTVKIKSYAPNGSAMTYTVDLIRADVPGVPTPTPQAPKVIEVSVDGTKYTIARDLTGVALPEGFEVKDFTYKGEVISTGKAATRNLMLMYLTSEGGLGAFYIYDEAADSFTKYIEIKTSNISYTILLAGKDVLIPTGFGYKTTAVLFGQSVTVWKQSEKAIESVFVFYGMNLNGEKNWYQYDSKEGTVQRYLNTSNSSSQGDSSQKLQSEIDKLKKDADNSKKSNDKSSNIKLTVIIILVVISLFLGFLIIFKLRRK